MLLLGVIGFVLLLCGVVFYLLRSAMLSRDKRAAELLTPEFLAKVFAERFRLGKEFESGGVRSVTIPSIARCGDGKASTTDRIVLQVTWQDQALQQRMGCPEEMVLKYSLLPGYLRLGASPFFIRATGKLANFLAGFKLDFVLFYFVNLYQRVFPHAPDPMYENETRFYKEIRAELSVALEAPAVYGTIYNPRECTYGIFMENLNLKKASFPNALDELSLAHISSLLQSLAVLHGSFWESPRFLGGGDLSWLPTPHSGGMEPTFHSIGFGMIRDHVRSHAWQREILAVMGLSIEQLWDGLLKAEDVLSVPPVTLCHGDTHIQNTYVLPNGKVGLFDWQLMLRATWARDVSYLLGTGLPPALRQQHEEQLLKMYLSCLSHELTLRASPTMHAPAFHDAKRLYAQSMAWGLVIGWLICPPANYGKEIWAGNVKRLVAACVHLDTFALLGVHPTGHGIQP